MSSAEQSEPRIIIDEDWKARVEAEREQLRQQEAKRTASETTAETGHRQTFNLPPASFPVLVELIATQALTIIADALQGNKDQPPAEKLPESARPVVRHFIDLLAVLEEKTRGNLTDAESRYLSQRLHELRMAYIELTL